MTILMHGVFILMQILRKDYHLIQLMQLPAAFFFGYLTDPGRAGRNCGCSHPGGADRETAGEAYGEMETGRSVGRGLLLR